jgi:hypothetical protein
MSYTTGTTHYNLPQTVGSDKRDWTDTNEAFSDVDAALWEAHQGATQAALDIASINSEIQTITGKQADDEADIATISGKVSTLETTVGNHTTEIGDVRRDLQDNIESLREDTATSTHAYEIGDYFYYNDVLFKATAQIAIGATIVPNTNCTGVTVMDELKNGGSVSVAAEDVTFNNTASGLVATDVQAAIDEVNTKVENLPGSEVVTVDLSGITGAANAVAAIKAAFDFTKVTPNTKLFYSETVWRIAKYDSTSAIFENVCLTTSAASFNHLKLGATNELGYYTMPTATYNDLLAAGTFQGTEAKIYY